jgi:hypothetical protein
MTLYPKLILDALATVRYPGNGKNIVEAEMVADNLRIDGMKVRHYCSIGATPNRCCSSCLTASDKMGLRGRVPLWVEGKTLLGFGISPNVIEDYKKSNDF